MNIYPEQLMSGAWTELADNEDYFIQNTDNESVYILASDSEPTISVGIDLPPKGVLTQVILAGKIWGRASMKKRNRENAEIGQEILVQK